MSYPLVTTMCCCGISHNMRRALAATNRLMLPCMLSSYRVYSVSEVCAGFRAELQLPRLLGADDRDLAVRTVKAVDRMIPENVQGESCFFLLLMTTLLFFVFFHGCPCLLSGLQIALQLQDLTLRCWLTHSCQLSRHGLPAGAAHDDDDDAVGHRT